MAESLLSESLTDPKSPNTFHDKFAGHASDLYIEALKTSAAETPAQQQALVSGLSRAVFSVVAWLNESVEFNITPPIDPQKIIDLTIAKIAFTAAGPEEPASAGTDTTQ